MLFLGIDNGQKGGLVAIDQNKNIKLCIPMPILITKTIKKGKKHAKITYDWKTIIKELTVRKPFIELCVIESIWLQGGQGGNMTIAEGHFMLCGILEALEIPYVKIRPQKWQKEIFKSDTSMIKKPSVPYCLNEQPEQNWKATLRSKKEHDGMTDAYCIAEYAKIFYNEHY